MFKPHSQGLGELFPPHLGDLIPEDDFCRVVSEVLDRLNLGGFAANYSPLGQHAYSPRTMLKLLMFGYAQGVRSSRAIEEKVHFDVRFRWLAGVDKPCKSAIADFRTRNAAQIEDVFVQVVRMCVALGMVQFGHWSIDGTKLKANAGKGARRRAASIEAELALTRMQIRQALAEAEAADAEDDEQGGPLPPTIRRKEERARRLEQALQSLKGQPGDRRANTTDPDAYHMKRKGGGFEPSYNPQITVDAHSQVVLAADVTVDRNDCAQLAPQLDQASENTGGRPGQVSADNGYFSGPNLASLEQREVRGYIPPSGDTNQRGKDGAQVLRRSDFHYDQQHDRFICPAGKELAYLQTKVRHRSTGSSRTRVYKKKGCSSCPLATRCLKPDSATRSIQVSEHEVLVLAMRERMSSDEGRAAYALRRQSAEPVFGIVKWPMAFRSFLVRGLKKVRSEWRLALAAFNIRKIWRSGALNAAMA